MVRTHFDSRPRAWAIASMAAAVALFLGLEWLEEPGLTSRKLIFELINIVPVALTSVGVALFFR